MITAYLECDYYMYVTHLKREGWVGNVDNEEVKSTGRRGSNSSELVIYTKLLLKNMKFNSAQNNTCMHEPLQGARLAKGVWGVTGWEERLESEMKKDWETMLKSLTSFAS
jgi:hypothetical protein